jgi:hypothetical protein
MTHHHLSAANATGAGSTVPELLARAEKYLAINAADGRGSGLLVMELADALRAVTLNEPQAAPKKQRYVAELSLKGRYVWCIVEAIPRVENVIEEFGCGPIAQKAAQDKLEVLSTSPMTRPQRVPQ